MILIRVVNWSLKSNTAVGDLKLFFTTIDRYHGVYNFLMKRKTSLIWAGLVFSVRVLNIQYSKNIYFFCNRVYFMCLYHFFIDIRYPSHLFHVSMDKKSILYHYTYHCYQTKNAQHKRHVTFSQNIVLWFVKKYFGFCNWMRFLRNIELFYNHYKMILFT